jgi:anti-sigma regulatory factor (Ser/Thr protein kinase)
MPALVLPVDGRSVAAARRFLRTVLDGHQATSSDEAVLMVSELVTNAVRHAHTLLRLVVCFADQTLRVEVHDDDPTLPAAPRPEHDATSGRGLRIIDDLADEWGITPSADGKTVWFEINFPSAGC